MTSFLVMNALVSKVPGSISINFEVMYNAESIIS